MYKNRFTPLLTLLMLSGATMMMSCSKNKESLSQAEYKQLKTRLEELESMLEKANNDIENEISTTSIEYKEAPKDILNCIIAQSPELAPTLKNALDEIYAKKAKKDKHLHGLIRHSLMIKSIKQIAKNDQAEYTRLIQQMKEKAKEVQTAPNEQGRKELAKMEVDLRIFVLQHLVYVLRLLI